MVDRNAGGPLVDCLPDAADAYSNSDAHSHPRTDRHAFSITKPDRYGHTDAYARTATNANPDGYTGTDRHAFAITRADRYGHTDAYARTAAVPALHAHRGV